MRDNFTDGASWKSYDRNASPIDSRRDAQPPLDEQLSDSTESPVFGPREEGLFRNEMPYDLDSPLSQVTLTETQYIYVSHSLIVGFELERISALYASNNFA